MSVVGSTGTGKTTFARELAAILGVPHVELDALAWGPRWTLAETDVFVARVRDAISGDAWVVDGNYGGRGAGQLIWPRADTIVWLDFSLGVIYRRLWRRTIERIRDRNELWPGTGNRESIRGAFLSRDSLFWWALKTYRRRRRNYARLFASPETADTRRFRFRRPVEADAWLRALREAARERV